MNAPLQPADLPRNFASMWITHLFRLLGRSWQNLVKATGTTTLGFIVWILALSAVSWAATVAARWFQFKQDKTPLSLREAISSSIWPQGAFLAVGIFGLVLVAFAIVVCATIYADHELLVSQNVELRQCKSNLESILLKKTHSLNTTDPVFPNIIYLLEAFNVFRHANKGAPCVLRLTAPPDSLPLAMMMAQFPLWADQIEYWHIDDIDCAPPNEALPILEQTIRELVERLCESEATAA